MQGSWLKHIFICLLTIITAFIIPGSAHARTDPGAFMQIDGYLQKELLKAHVPGMAIVIVNKDEVLFSNTYGDCDSLNMPFIIGSLSKSFTAIAIMQLAESNKIDINDYAFKYLPDLGVGSMIIIRHLLNQTSGFTAYQRRNDLKIRDFRFIHLYEYANVNYDLLGEIIGTISGMNYEDYIKKNIFAPIGMDHSYTSLEEAKNDRLIPGYRNYFGFPVPREIKSFDRKGWISVSGAYLISSASDMGKYLQMYLNNGNGIISAESVYTIFYNNVYDLLSSTYYGMGWTLNNNYREPVLGHSGLVENYMSYMFILPQSDIGVVMLANTNDYFVSNNMINDIGENLILQFTEDKPLEPNSKNYAVSHLLINLIYLTVILASAAPILFLKKWIFRVKNMWRSKIMLKGALLHIIIPTLLLFMFSFFGAPFFAIRRFVPDLYLVLIISAALLYVTGIVKIAFLIKITSKTEVL